MRALWVTSVFPSPEGGGQAARQFGLLRVLAQQHEVTILTTDWSAQVASVMAVRDLGARIRVVPFRARRRPRTRVTKLLRVLAGAEPALGEWMRSTRIGPLRAAIAEEVRERPPDVLQVYGGDLAPVLDGVRVPSSLLVTRPFSADDRESSSLQRLMRRSLEQPRARRWEQVTYARADDLAASTEEDARYLSRLIGRRVSSVGPAEDGAATLESSWRALFGPGSRTASAPPSFGLPEAASVVVCTRARPDMLARSLASVASAASQTAETSVIVVEQGASSAQGVCDDLQLRATIIHDDGFGVSRARNIGLRAATTDLVLFTDDDCEVPGRWIADHVEELSQGSIVASFGPVTGLSRDDETRDPAALPARHGKASPPWLVGHASNMAVRTAALLSVGGFDERIGPGSGGVVAGEDADVIARLLRAGARVASGTGEPVRHIEWRSKAGNEANLLAYEEGAGVWIGKALREDFWVTLPFLRERLDMIKARSGAGRPLSRALLRGLGAGLRLNGWKPPR